MRGLDMAAVADALEHFVGAHRRFELTSVTDGVRCYTDYGHNPAEIKNAIQIAGMQEHRNAVVGLAAAHLFAHENAVQRLS